MRAVWTAFVAVALSACSVDRNRDGVVDGREPTKVVEQGSSRATGNISGQVLDSSFAPIAGATVTAVLPGADGTFGADSSTSALTAITDATGYWTVGPVAAGSSATISISKQGYGTLRTNATVPSDLGNRPVTDTNIFAGRWLLLQLNGTVKFRVLGRTGLPAKGARAVLEVSPVALAYNNFAIVPSANNNVVLAEATADDSGVLTFTNVPSPEEMYRLLSIFSGSRYRLIIGAVDEDGDGVVDSAGQTSTYTAGNLYLGDTTTVIRLADARAGEQPTFSLLASNVTSLNGETAPTRTMVKTSEPLTFIFSHAVQVPSLSFRLTDESGTRAIPLGPPTVTNGREVRVQPVTPLETGKEYNLALHAVSADTGAVLDQVGFLFTGEPTVPNPGTPDITTLTFRDTGNGAGGAPDGLLNPGETVTVTFNQPMGYFGDLAQDAFFTPPPIAHFNRDLDGSGAVGNTVGEVGYPTGFDLYFAEAIQEPGTLFRLAASDYSSRFLISFLGPGNVPADTEVHLAFDQLRDPSTGLQGLWGQPARTVLKKRLTVAASQ